MSFQVKTATHARFLAAAAVKRAAKAIAEAEAAQAAAREYEELANTLPESNNAGSVPAEHLSLTAGQRVSFEHGRADKRRAVSDAVIVAVKAGEDGKAKQYKVQYGEGFDQQFQVIFPGQITDVYLDAQ